jgi:hypothetical protein
VSKLKEREMEMNVLNFDFDIVTGFAWIIVDSKNESENWTVQCRLKTEEYSKQDYTKPVLFLLEIDQSNSGHDFGLCGDVNQKAFEYWGENRCMSALYAYAKKAGIKLS